MTDSYPPGVTGNEYAIAGPDYEKESDERCPKCDEELMELGYRGERWLACYSTCGYTMDLPPIEPDPDRAYDEARDRQMFGEDV